MSFYQLCLSKEHQAGAIPSLRGSLGSFGHYFNPECGSIQQIFILFGGQLSDRFAEAVRESNQREYLLF